MLQTTRVAITAIAKADPSITPEQLREALDVLAGKTTGGAVQPVARAVRPKQAAEALGVCPRTLRRYATAGLIQPIYRTAGAKRRAVAYTADSIAAFVNGKGAANA